MASTQSFLYPPPRQMYKGDLSQRARDRKVSEPFIFCGFEFHEPVNFSGVTFENGVEFRRCIFHEPVNFVGAHFRGAARFWKTVFRKRTDFTWAVFEKREQGPLGSVHNGEANFSWSRFQENAEFFGAQFHGPVFFWRMTFEKWAKLEARFESDVIFEGNPGLVCIERSDFGNSSGLFDGLNQAGLLSEDKEDSCCANMSLVDDERALEARLKSVGFNPDSTRQVKSVLARLGSPVFSVDGASFQGAYFANPETVTFRNVNLKTCRFLNSNAGGVHFENVQWDRRPTLLWATDRRAVCDERPVGNTNEPTAKGGEPTAETLGALGKLYYELRLNHEGKGLFDEAIDFLYGEMETKRLSQAIPLRQISLTAWYRYLSAYGARPGLALFWLVAAIFIFFPLLYVVAGLSHDPVKAILHSLETSTFLETPKSATEAASCGVPIAAKFVAGFERLVVPLQAALFAFAIQRKFGRK